MVCKLMPSALGPPQRAHGSAQPGNADSALLIITHADPFTTPRIGREGIGNALRAMISCSAVLAKTAVVVVVTRPRNLLRVRTAEHEGPDNVAIVAG
jgi:hypothetical protein